MSDPGTPPADAARITQLSEGVPGGVRALVELFVSHTAQTAAELRAAVDGSSAADVQRLAHRVCGSAGAFGADHLLSLLRQLEAAGKRRDLAPVPALMTELDAEIARVHAFLNDLAAGEGGTS